MLNKFNLVATTLTTQAVLTGSNPYVTKAISYLTDVKGWILTIIGILTAVVVAVYGTNYISGNGQEKAKAWEDIKKTIVMGGGIFFLAWLAIDVASFFAS